MFNKKGVCLLSVVAVLGLAGCASKPAPVVQKVEPVVQKSSTMAERGRDGRTDVRRTVDNIVDYCDEWAKAYELRLGKKHEDGYNECVALTAEMMRKSAEEKGKRKQGDGYPFDVLN